MKRTLLVALTVIAALAGGFGQALHVLGSGASKALVYCPVGIDATGCSRIVAALSGAEGPFPGGVDRGYDGTGGTIDLRTADLSPYAVFVVPSLADDAALRPYALLRESAVAYRLSRALRGRFVTWSGTPDQGSPNRDQKDRLLRNLASWSSEGEGAGLLVLQDHSEDATRRYDWLKGIGGLAVRPAADGLQAYDTVKALTLTGTGVLAGAGRGLAYPNMASFGILAPAA